MERSSAPSRSKPTVATPHQNIVNLTPIQRAFYNSPSRFKLIIGRRGSGRTTALLAALYFERHRLFATGDRTVLFVAGSRSVARQAACDFQRYGGEFDPMTMTNRDEASGVSVKFRALGSPREPLFERYYATLVVDGLDRQAAGNWYRLLDGLRAYHVESRIIASCNSNEDGAWPVWLEKYVRESRLGAELFFVPGQPLRRASL